MTNDKVRRATSDTVNRVLMVSPKHFSIEYAINAWMHKHAVVDKQKAMEQWRKLKASIEQEGVKVITVDQVQGLPDMVFACNSGLAYRNQVYLSKYKHAERTGEQKHFADSYKQLGFHLLGTDYPEFFEGGGDAVFSDQYTLWAAWGGPRTSKKAYEHVRALGDDFEIVLCELVDRRFYHLDTCFCPIGVDSALWFPEAFSIETQKEIERRLPNAIAVSKEEAYKFVCNALTIRKKVISPRGVAAKTRKALAKLGYSVDELDMGEFMKGGGACQCLVMKL